MVVSFIVFSACDLCFLWGGGVGGGEKAPFSRSLSLCPCLFLSYSTVITTKIHNMEIKILQPTVLTHYVLNPNMKIRILLHTI